MARPQGPCPVRHEQRIGQCKACRGGQVEKAIEGGASAPHVARQRAQGVARGKGFGTIG
jgi:hypothetical protein